LKGLLKRPEIKKKKNLPFEISNAKKEEGRYCCAYACRNAPVRKKGGLCHKHYARKLRHKDPIQVRYNQLRSSARQRGREVRFTLEEFRQWCHRHGYLTIKGNRGYNATLDRRCNTQDYYLWNLQLMSHRSNASKGNRTNGDNFECPF